MHAPAAQPSAAILVLEDGRTFRGDSYGAAGETFGEAVFSTGMSGYQETLTDPSYHRQVVVMTAPHIGNTGMNDEDAESSPDLGRPGTSSATRPGSRRTGGRSARLDDELRDQGIVGICGIDTRALTRHLRERGAMRVGVSSVETDPQALLDRVLDAAGDARRQPRRRGQHRRVVRRPGGRRAAVHRRRPRPRHQVE